MAKSPVSSARTCYSLIAGKRGVNLYELLSALVVLSWANWKSKIRFLACMFDFEETGALTVSELAMLLESTGRGVGLMTGTSVPLHRYFD